MSEQFFKFNQDNDKLFRNYNGNDMVSYSPNPNSASSKKIYEQFLSVWDGAHTGEKNNKIDKNEIRAIYEELKSLYGKDGVLTVEEAEQYLKSKNNTILTGRELIEMLNGPLLRTLVREASKGQESTESTEINETSDVIITPAIRTAEVDYSNLSDAQKELQKRKDMQENAANFLINTLEMSLQVWDKYMDNMGELSGQSLVEFSKDVMNPIYKLLGAEPEKTARDIRHMISEQLDKARNLLHAPNHEKFAEMFEDLTKTKYVQANVEEFIRIGQTKDAESEEYKAAFKKTFGESFMDTVSTEKTIENFSEIDGYAGIVEMTAAFAMGFAQAGVEGITLLSETSPMLNQMIKSGVQLSTWTIFQNAMNSVTKKAPVETEDLVNLSVGAMESFGFGAAGVPVGKYMVAPTMTKLAPSIENFFKGVFRVPPKVPKALTELLENSKEISGEQFFYTYVLNQSPSYFAKALGFGAEVTGFSVYTTFEELAKAIYQKKGDLSFETVEEYFKEQLGEQGSNLTKIKIISHFMMMAIGSKGGMQLANVENHRAAIQGLDALKDVVIRPETNDGKTTCTLKFKGEEKEFANPLQALNYCNLIRMLGATDGHLTPNPSPSREGSKGVNERIESKTSESDNHLTPDPTSSGEGNNELTPNPRTSGVSESGEGRNSEVRTSEVSPAREEKGSEAKILEGGISDTELEEVAPFAERLEKTPTIEELTNPEIREVTLENGEFDKNGNFISDGTITVKETANPLAKGRDYRVYSDFNEKVASTLDELYSQLAKATKRNSLLTSQKEKIKKLIDSHPEMSVQDFSIIFNDMVHAFNSRYVKTLISNGLIGEIKDLKTFKSNIETYDKYLTEIELTGIYTKYFRFLEKENFAKLGEIKPEEFTKNLEFMKTLSPELQKSLKDDIFDKKSEKFFERISFLNELYDWKNKNIERLYERDYVVFDSELLSSIDKLSDEEFANIKNNIQFAKDLVANKAYYAELLHKIINRKDTYYLDIVDKLKTELGDNFDYEFFARADRFYEDLTPYTKLINALGKKNALLISSYKYGDLLAPYFKDKASKQEILNKITVLEKLPKLSLDNYGGFNSSKVEQLFYKPFEGNLEKAVEFLKLAEPQFLKEFEISWVLDVFKEPEIIDKMIADAKLHKDLPESFLEHLRSDKSMITNNGYYRKADTQIHQYRVSPEILKSRIETINKYADRIPSSVLEYIYNGNLETTDDVFEMLGNTDEIISSTLCEYSRVNLFESLDKENLQKFAEYTKRIEITKEDAQKFANNMNENAINCLKSLTVEELELVPLTELKHMRHYQTEFKENFNSVPKRIRDFIKKDAELDFWTDFYNSQGSSKKKFEAKLKYLMSFSDVELENIGSKVVVDYLNYCNDDTEFNSYNLEFWKTVGKDVKEKLDKHARILLQQQTNIDIESFNKKVEFLKRNDVLNHINSSAVLREFLELDSQEALDYLNKVIPNPKLERKNTESLIRAIINKASCADWNFVDEITNYQNTDLNDLSSIINSTATDNKDLRNQSQTFVRALMKRNIPSKDIDSLLDVIYITGRSSGNAKRIEYILELVDSKHYQKFGSEIANFVKHMTDNKSFDIQKALLNDILEQDMYSADILEKITFNFTVLERFIEERIDVFRTLMVKNHFSEDAINKIREHFEKCKSSESIIKQHEVLKFLIEKNLKEKDIANITECLNEENLEFTKKLVSDETIIKSNITGLLNAANTKETRAILEKLYDSEEFPNDKLTRVAGYIKSSNENVQNVNSMIKTPEMRQWLVKNLDNNLTIDEIYTLSGTQKQLFNEAKNASTKKNTVQRTETVNDEAKGAEAVEAKPEDVIKAEEALVAAGVHPKATTGYIKICQENGFVDKVKLDATCALATVCDANEVKSLIKEIKNIFNLAVGSPLSNANGVFRPDIIKDIVAFKQSGIADFKLAANLSAAKNMSAVEFKSRLNSKTREDLAARVRDLEPEIKNRLKEQGYDIEALADKAVANPKIPSGAKLVNAAPQKVQLRALDSIVGVEKIILNKYKAEIDQNIWGDAERFKAWAEAKLQDMMDFDKHPEYTSVKFPHFNNARQEGIQKWYKFMTEESNARDDVFSQLLVMESIVSEMKPDNAFTPPAVSHASFEETLNVLLNTNTKVSFSDIYAEQIVKNAIEQYGEPTQFVDGIEGRWVTIPHSKKGEPDYDDHIAMVQNLSRGSSWCLRYENAHTYLQKGRISFFLDKNGNAQVAINITPEGKIYDLEKRYNQDRTVPVPYCQVIEEFLNKQGIDDWHTRRDAALKAKPKFDEEKTKFAELQKQGDVLAMFKELGINVKIADDGTYILNSYSPKRGNYTLFDLNVDEDALMQNVSEIKSSINLDGSALKAMPKLRILRSSITLGDCKISDLRNLEILNNKKVYWDNGSNEGPDGPNGGNIPQGMTGSENKAIEKAKAENPASAVEKKIIDEAVKSGEFEDDGVRIWTQESLDTELADYEINPQKSIDNAQTVSLILNGKLNEHLSQRYDRMKAVFDEIIKKHNSDFEELATTHKKNPKAFAEGVIKILAKELGMEGFEPPVEFVTHLDASAAFDNINGKILVNNSIRNTKSLVEMLSHEFIHLLQFRDIIAQYGEQGLRDIVMNDNSVKNKEEVLNKALNNPYNRHLIDDYSHKRTENGSINDYIRRIYLDEFTNPKNEGEEYTNQVIEREAYSNQLSETEGLDSKYVENELSEAEIEELRKQGRVNTIADSFEFYINEYGEAVLLTKHMPQGKISKAIREQGAEAVYENALNEVRDLVAKNLKNFLSREKYIVIKNNFMDSEAELDKYLTFSLRNIIENSDKISPKQFNYIKQLMKEVILERINDKSKPEDFSEIPTIENKGTKFSSFFLTKDILAKFLDMGFGTQDVGNMISELYLFTRRKFDKFKLDPPKNRNQKIKKDTNNANNEEILKRLKAEEPLNKISEELDLPLDIVRAVKESHGFKYDWEIRAERREKITYDEFKFLIDEGLGIDDIGEHLELSKADVQYLLEKYQLDTAFTSQQKRVNSPEFLEQVKQYHAKGLSIKEIATLLEATPMTIAAKLKNLGLYTEGQIALMEHRDEENVAEVIRLYTEEKMSMLDIDNYFGWKKNSARNVLINNGIIEEAWVKNLANNPENIEKVSKLYNDGLNITQISAETGLQSKVVSEIFKQQNFLSERQKRQQELADEDFQNKVIEMFVKEGKTPSAIGKELNKHFVSIVNILREKGLASEIQKNKQQKEIQLVKQIREMVAKNYSNKKITEELNIGELTLLRLAEKNQIKLLSDISEANYSDLSDTELKDILYDFYCNDGELQEHHGFSDIMDAIDYTLEFTKEEHENLAKFVKIMDSSLKNSEKLNSAEINTMLNWVKELNNKNAEFEKLQRKFDNKLNELSQANDFLLYSLCSTFKPDKIENSDDCKFILDTFEQCNNDFDLAKKILTYWEYTKHPDEILKKAEIYAKDKQGNISAADAGEYILCINKFKVAINDITDSNYKQYADIINKMLIDDGKHNYTDAYKLLSIYDNIPEQLKPILLQKAQKSALNSHIFISTMNEFKERVALCNIEKNSEFQMYNNQGAFMGKCVITTKAKQECWKYCKGDFDMFYEFMKAFYDSATKMVPEASNSPGVKDLKRTKKTIFAEIKIVGRHGFGDMRLYATTEGRNAYYEEDNEVVKFVFDKFDSHKFMEGRK